MSWHVGVDGGGTRARAVLVDEAGRVVHRVEGPAGIVRQDDASAAAAVVADLTRTLLAGRDGVHVASLCCGLAGAGRGPERDAVRDALLAAGVADSVSVVGDAEAAMFDAFGLRPGVLLIAGTGSIAWARSEAGDTVRVGGWGHLLGDEGSGYAIGLAGLRAVVRAHDGRAPATSLTAAVLAAAAVPAVEDLVRFAARATKGQIGSFARVVLGCADTGDPAAAAVRDAAVHDLAELAAVAATRAGLAAPAVALGGGLVEKGGSMRQAVVSAISARMPAASLVDRDIDAARGAASLGTTQTEPPG